MPKVYAYGCKRPDRETAEAIKGQLWLAHRYRTMLWHLSMAGRSLYRAQRREHVPGLVETEGELERAGELFTLIDAKESPAEYRELKVRVQQLRAKCRELRDAAKTHPGLIADTAEASDRRGVLQRALRNVFSRTFGLYSGTYLHIEAASRSANAGTEDPVRPRWDGSGALAIQLQGGHTPLERRRNGGSEPLDLRLRNSCPLQWLLRAL